jgi:hypothetical protein
MAQRLGAPRLTEREDPLSFLLRSRPAREILERLEGHPFVIPLPLRKSIGIHPEAFRRIISELNEFALISIRPLPHQEPGRGRSRGILRIPIGIELTKTGRNLLLVTRAARRRVRKYAELLPYPSAEHWLE